MQETGWIAPVFLCAAAGELIASISKRARRLDAPGGGFFVCAGGAGHPGGVFFARDPGIG